jgi:nucleoside-diphosphate-sugar epimerase
MGHHAPADGVRRTGAEQLSPPGRSRAHRLAAAARLGSATAPRTFIGIDNLADAVVRCVEHPRAVNQIFLMGDGETASTAHFVHRIAAALNRRVWTPRVPPVSLRTGFRLASREHDFHRLFDPLELDTSPMRALIDWTPPISLDEGLRRAVRDTSTIASVGSGHAASRAA